MPRKYTKAGLSWQDVDNALTELQKEYQVYAEVSIKTGSLGIAQNPGLRVTLVVTRIEGGGGKGGVRRFAMAYPTYGQRTLPGLILQLVHDAGNSLSEQHIKCTAQCKYGAYNPG